ncbi:6-phosphogluconolactonase [Parasteatoda tepidariorum]|uniref:6-phosphogluconolactonase n=1 Tax=Parasteatoda tepidariorum TaxID=114398 RepID=UPI00077FC039|nr:6-phosphogluconolactonase [Parasteatoda tepidariorum]
MAPVEVNVCSNEIEVISSLSKLIESKANETLQKNNCFRVGLSGGSLIKFLCKGLPSVNTNWQKWQFFFCDERLVPFDDKESTFGCYKRDLMPLIPITESQFITIDPSLKGEDSAQDYTRKIEQEFRISSSFPKFDLLLLGIGPDGHTCSLFPNHPLLKEEKKWVASIDDSPKPPPSRITLTLPVLNNSKCAVFATIGESKAEILKEILEGNSVQPLPAALVRPTQGELHWIVDREAAKLLL